MTGDKQLHDLETERKLKEVAQIVMERYNDTLKALAASEREERDRD